MKNERKEISESSAAIMETFKGKHMQELQCVTVAPV